MDKRYCIFDMDGTLVDSMPYWKSLGGDYIRSKGAEPDGRLNWMVQAMTMTEGAEYFIRTYGIPGPPERVVAEMEAMMAERYRRDAALKPGAGEYLAALRARGCRLCAATATAELLARQCFRRLGVEGLFEFVLSCETLGVSKSSPDVYLRAAEGLGARPEECAVFEDALYAAKTAKEAGFYTVAVREGTYARDWPELCRLADENILDWRELL
ncbi:MAG: HAD family phosphatase [Lawsonibacter sp.]|nr:HAD family phosphatase [Lawsonibacter sp.]